MTFYFSLITITDIRAVSQRKIITKRESGESREERHTTLY